MNISDRWIKDKSDRKSIIIEILDKTEIGGIENKKNENREAKLWEREHMKSQQERIRL